MKKFVIILIFFLAIVFVFLSFSELQSTIETLKRGNFWFVGLAMLVEILWLANLGWTYHSLYHLLHLEERRSHLMLVASAATFVNIVTATAGMGGMALFIRNGIKRGHPPGRITVVGALFVLIDYTSFLCVLALGLVVLVRRNDLDMGEIIASLILLALAIGLTAMLLLGSRSARTLGNVLAWMARLINRVVRPFIHRDYLSEERAHTFAAEIADGLSSLRTDRRSLLQPMIFGLINKALLICILVLTFLAFEVPFSAGTIIGGFSIGYLFQIVSPTPSGVGFMESALALALTSLRVPWSQAVVLTLSYRAVTFWLPLGIGAIAFRLLQREEPTKFRFGASSPFKKPQNDEARD